jgi:tetratricopeptide (TPR) repeat protein
MVATVGNRRVLELGPLDEDESRSLLVELVGATQANDARVEALLRNARGNPLFLEETVRMVADAALDPDSSAEALPIPDNLQALIGSRLDALAAREKRVAQQASVVGSVFWASAVAHLDGSSDRLAGSLATLERRDFVQANEQSSIAGDLEYAFKHILIRDVAYERLPKGRRAELHVLFTDWLTGLPGPDLEFIEIVAYHLEQACLLAAQIARSPIEPPVLAAASALARAADKAQRREGWREAGRYYERALALLGDAHPQRTLELRLLRARTFAGIGEVSQAWDELLTVAEQALELDRRDLRGSALITLGNIDHRQGRPSDARRRLAEAHTLAEELGDASLRIRATFGLAAVQGDYKGEFEEAVDGLRHAIAIAEETEDRTLRVEGHLRLGFHFFNMGEIALAEQELLRCMELAGELGSLRDEARAAFLLGLVKYYRGDSDEAKRLNLQARDWLERTGERYFQMQNFRALGMYALAQNDLDGAERWLRDAIPVAIEEGGRYMFEVYRFLTETFIRQGRISDAAALVEFASRGLPPEDLVAQAYVLLARAALSAAQGDRVGFDMYQQAIGRLVEQRLPIEAADARVTYATALLELGDIDYARAELTTALDAFERMGATGPCAQIVALLERAASGGGRPRPARSA